MIKLLMVADDFTGALDTGVQLSVKGIRTKVVTRTGESVEEIPDIFQGIDPGIEVLVYDAQSRHLTPQMAGEVVGRVTAYAVEHGIRYLYKKTDSALRGNVGAELSAMLMHSQEKLLAFVPAFPKMKRWTEDGVHYIDQIPVGESAFAKDPFNPVLHSNVGDVIREQSDVPVQVVKKAGIPVIHSEGILIYDAATQEDMKRIADSLKAEDRIHVFAGCAGFASELPYLLGLDEKEVLLPKTEQKITVFCGSIHPVTKRQIEVACEHGFIRIHITDQEKLEKDYFSGEDALVRYEEVIREKPYVIIDSSDGSSLFEEESFLETGLSVEEVRCRIATAIGQLMRRLSDTIDLGLVLVTGGDTLFQCMKELGVAEMVPIGEVFPGVVLAEYVYQGERRYVITKSGGFGEETLLPELVKKIEGGWK